jgi:hypothetical protein
VKTHPAFGAEAPRLLFRGTYTPARFTLMDNEYHPWDISPDGSRFLMAIPTSESLARPFTVVLN